jgi:hypothetical protein
MSKNIALDLKKFKHVKSDKNSTTLQHADGHTLTIAHKALTPKMQTQLSALSRVATDAQTTQNKDELKHKSTAANPTSRIDTGHGRVIAREAEGGEIERKEYAEGTPDMPVSQDDAVPSVPADMPAQAPVQAPTQAPVQAPTQAPIEQKPQVQKAAQPQQPQVDPELVRKRELYNNLVKSGTVLPSNETPAPKETMMFGPKGEAPAQFSPANWTTAEQMYQREQANNAADAAAAQQKAIQINSQRVAAGLPPLPVPNVPQGPQIPGSEDNPTDATPPDKVLNPTAPNALAAENPLSGSMQDMQGMLESGYQSKLAGIQQQAAAQGALGEQQAELLKNQEQAKLDAKVSYQRHFDDLNAERENLVHDVQNGYISPDKFWTGDAQGNGGHSKIAAGIGMILAGFNPTSRPNAAIDFLKHQMDLNIQAQKENLGAKQNLLAQNLRQFGNLRDATDMTRLMQTDILETQLKAAAAKAASPMAKAAALQAAGALKMETAPMFQQFAMRRAMMNLANNGGNPNSVEQLMSYMRVVNPEMAKDMQERYVPGVGLASIPVPQDIRQEMVGKKDFDQQAKEYIKFAKQHQGSWNPESIARGAAMAGELQGAYRRASKGGVYKEGEQEFIEKLVPSDPTQYLASLRTLPKIEALVHNNNLQFRNMSKTYGLQEQPAGKEAQGVGPQATQAAMAWAKANPKDPRAAKILQLLGH